MAVEFKVGDKIVWHTQHGGYAETYSGVRTIVRETKSCFVTDKDEYIRKDNHEERGWNDTYSSNTALPLTDELAALLAHRRLIREVEQLIHDTRIKDFPDEKLQKLKELLS